MVLILQMLTEISFQMQTFDDLEHTSRSLNACIYYEISVSFWRIVKKLFDDEKSTFIYIISYMENSWFRLYTLLHI